MAILNLKPVTVTLQGTWRSKFPSPTPCIWMKSARSWFGADKLS
ncbi:hypothetical protein [Pedosphaera parvula]|nr:hypothetical protein [Pedosphaera parvula]